MRRLPRPGRRTRPRSPPGQAAQPGAPGRRRHERTVRGVPSYADGGGCTRLKGPVERAPSTPDAGRQRLFSTERVPPELSHLPRPTHSLGTNPRCIWHGLHGMSCGAPA